MSAAKLAAQLAGAASHSDAGSSLDGAKAVNVEERLRVQAQSAPGPTGICLVGLGRAGQFHLNSLRLVGPHIARLVCAVDVNAEAAQRAAREAGGCEWRTSFEEVLADPALRSKVDAVIVCSTTDTHFPLCKQALSAGLPTFTEKPISHHRSEVEEIVSLAKEAKVPFIVGYQRRVDKNFRALRDMIVTGKVLGNTPGAGPSGGAEARERSRSPRRTSADAATVTSGPANGVRMIKCTSRDNPIPPLPYLKTSGGIFHDMLSHDFDMIHFLTGEIPEEVFTIGHCYEPDIATLGDVDTVMVTLKYKSGLLATVDCSRVAAYGYDQRVEVFGEKGMLSANNEVCHTVELATDAGHLRPCTEWSFPERYRQTYTVELTEFLNMVRSSPQIVEQASLLERHVLLGEVARAAEISLKERRNVKLAELE